MDRLRHVRRLPWVFAFGLALTPVFFGVGPRLEAAIFPVVRDTVLKEPTRTAYGTSFWVSFRKVRSCEFKALVWYEGPVRLVVDFEPHADAAPASRPVGAQYAGPWLVRGLANLEGSRAHVYHRCHPLWVTITPFYQG